MGRVFKCCAQELRMSATLPLGSTVYTYIRYSSKATCGLPGEHVRVNLQTGKGTDAGARNILHQPLGTRFDQVS